MKQAPLWAVVVACAGGSALAQPFFTDFESDDGGFTGTGDWQYGMPTGFDMADFGDPEPVGGHSGDYAWGTIIGGQHSPSTTSVLTLAGINMDTAETLSFWEYSESGGNSFDMAQVFVGGTEVYLSDGDSGAAWREVSIDLTSFTGTQDIAWVFTTTTVVERVGWYIDDVSVTAVPAPASAALLGLGGLAATRRRRA